MRYQHALGVVVGDGVTKEDAGVSGEYILNMMKDFCRLEGVSSKDSYEL